MKRRIIMSMLAGATLLASTLLGASRIHGSAGCYDRSLATVQGVLTEDHRDC